MSHAKERTEKDCLNCGTLVQGRYCQQCGQENIVPKESFWGLVLHYFYDITHFDSKFFDSLRYLLFKPGYLTAEYMKGRRARYLNPVRMYVFTSALFFLIFFLLFNPHNAIKFNGHYAEEGLNKTERDSVINRLEQFRAKNPEKDYVEKQILLLKDTARKVTWGDLTKLNEDFAAISFSNKRYHSLKEYDSVQHSLPASEKDSWFSRLVHRREIEVNTRYAGRPDEVLTDIVEVILHKLPYLLIISLPFFALILKLLYIRHKGYYYADHAIFSIHHYIFSFIFLLFFFAFNKLAESTDWSIFQVFNFLLVLLWFFYLYKGMRNFYKQGRAKTILKYLLLTISALIFNSFLLVLLFFMGVFLI